MPPLSLYIHFPWCLKKCPYCDFNSHEVRGGIPENEYIGAVLRDLDATLPGIGGRTAATAFIGGGTPSLLSPAGLDTLLAGVSRRLSFASDIEITLEANPGAIEAGKFAGFRDAGITRLSLGIQSFEDAKLRSLGRIHSTDEARRAAELALRHFERVNLDLMYGLPGQTLAEARRDIETAIAFAPGHISAYHLTLEPNTVFFNTPPKLPDDDLAADMQEMVEETLATAGYEHYETSAFARAGQRCRHNLNYWSFGDYLGIGAGAHSKITPPPFAPLTGGSRMLASLDIGGVSADDSKRIAPSGAYRVGSGRPFANAEAIVREARPRSPKDYLVDPATRKWQPIARDDLAGEFMMNALRLVEGFETALFEQRTGLPLAVVEPALQQAENEGLLVREAGRIEPTLLGQRFLNRLVGLFLSS